MKKPYAFYFWPAVVYLLYAGANISAYAKRRRKHSPKHDAYTDQACAEFHEENPIGSGWVRSDCEAVWSRWASTLMKAEFRPFPIRDIFKGTTTALRQEGNPCLVDSARYYDGAGSADMRLLATWMFAESMGCDWITPKSPKSTIDETGTSLYCHRAVPRPDKKPNIPPGAQGPDNAVRRCEVMNWHSFFHYDAHGVKGDRNGTDETIHVRPNEVVQVLETRISWLSSAVGRANLRNYLPIKYLREHMMPNPNDFMRVVEEYKEGRANRRWEHLLLYFPKNEASEIFLMVSSWNSYKREITRSVLQRFRESFYEFPRPWHDTNPRCMHSSSPRELNFAIHMRLGDRAITNKVTQDYPEYLEAFMAKLTVAVTDRGLDLPRFHVFSETAIPCPSEDTGTFPEFPMWPVEAYQIASCLKPSTPEDCPEKQAGAPACNPERSGIFRVAGRPLFLHVGVDVQNDMSCMIQADGILMGCSTFGQIAGVLNKGIKFFSFECSGKITPAHYKMMPPLAIAEKGSMWTPISGSWRDPVIMSQEILETALDDHLRNIGELGR